MSFINWGNESPEQLRIRKRLEEQMLLEQAMQNAAMAATAGVGSGGRPTEFKMLVNTTDNTLFEMEVDVTEDTAFTFITGKGTTFTGQLTTGTTNISYDYELEDSVWEAKLIVEDPSLVSRINIYSWRTMEFSNLKVFKGLEIFDADNNFIQSANFSGMSSLINIDMSDCQFPGQVGKSLTSVNLTGCTNLEQLRLDDSDFSSGFLTSLTGISDCSKLTYLDLDDCELSGEIDLRIFPDLDYVDLRYNEGITNAIISNEQPIADFLAQDCSLTQSALDSILVALSQNGKENGECILDGASNGIPSSTGLAAKAVLEGNGWLVDVNLPPPGTATIAPSTDFDIVGDFTIEMFVNLSNLTGNIRPYSFGAYPTAANAVSFESGTIYFWANSGARSFGSFTPSTGQWYHVCVMRSAGDIYIFIDGTFVAAYAYPDPIPSQGLPLTIGNGNEPNSSLNGLISNFRWTSSAVYNTAGFTVPASPLTDLPDTKLLIFQGTSLNAQLTDNSGNGHNAFGSGMISYSTEDPFGSLEGSTQLGTV